MFALLVFSFPIIIGNLFQQIYTMADSAIAGRFISEQALAAIGASYSLTNIFICVAIGGGIGASVLVSQFFGAKEYKKMKISIYTAFISFLIISVILSGIGIFFSRKIMILLNTPSDCLDLAIIYLKIYFLALPFLFMYNVLAAMYNALGKSQITLYFLIFSSVCNIILDLVFVIQFDMGVAGLAWATLLAQGISAVLSFFMFLRIINNIYRDHTQFFNNKLLKSMSKIALPSIFQQSTVAVGMMLVQSVVNSFGSQTLAGFSAAMRIESICVVPMMGIGNAVSSYTAQNIGANKQERVIEGYRAANKIVFICSVIIFLILEIFNRPIISLFIGVDGTSLASSTGQNYLRFMGWFFVLIGLKMTVDGLLRGAGDMKVFTIANLVNLLIRIAFAVILAPRYGISMVWIAVPIGWFANWIISFSQYSTGKWKRINI
ncbi:MAG: MATE family efflux transporter [Sphaerochaeta sp.]